MKFKLFFPAVVFSLAVGKMVSGQTTACDVVQITPNPEPPRYYSPDSSKYFINIQDTADKFQIYVGNAGDTIPVCISAAYTNGNCCGLFRSWETRNKLQVQWHPSGDFLICAVEKEFYNELLYVPYNTLMGWLQCGLWMDIWAVTPDGNNWYNLASTEGGYTGPAFTPDGSRCAWAEAMDSSNLAVDVFGVWKLWLSDFTIDTGTPSFAASEDISPVGARWIEPGNFSPDGESLLISADIGMVNAEGQDQYILNVANAQITNLTNSPMVWDEHGIFSPDGNKILFMSSYPYQSDTNSYHTLSIKTEFMLMNKDGSELQQLTHFRDTGYAESHEGIAATGCWTPDGTRIFAQSLIFPDYENWIIDFYGQCGNDTTTELPEIQPDNDLKIYPNPVVDQLFIEADNFQCPAQLRIINTNGKMVKGFTSISINMNTLGIQDLPAGLYLILISYKNNTLTKRFIKS